VRSSRVGIRNDTEGPPPGGGSDRSLPGPIPHTISGNACIDFVNSRFSEHTGGGRIYDRLELPEWREWFVEQCGLRPLGPITAATLQELVRCRRLLRQLLESRQTPSPSEMGVLNRWLGGPSLYWEITGGGAARSPVLRWRDHDWRALIAVVALAYARLLSEGRLGRVRRCANPNCSFLFLDESPNRSKRWCDAAICGDLIAVRRHRSRALGSGRARP